MVCLSILMACTEATSSADTNRLEVLINKAGLLTVPELPPPVDIRLQDLQGNRVRLSDYKGQIVFLNFWATWCPNCREEIPAMKKLHQQFLNRRFVILSVNLKESEATVQGFARRHNINFPILLDKKGIYARHFGIRSIPTTFILNKKGAIIGKVFGPRNWNNRASTSLFEYLIDGP